MGIFSIIWNQFKTLIVFILLEGIALILIFSLNTYQNSYFFQTTSSLRSNVLSTFSLLNDYFNLDFQNRELARENAVLHEKLKNIHPFALDLSLDTTKQYNYIPSKVVYSTIGNPDNYIVVNKGLKDGIQPDMAVISPDGLVGVVYEVSENYSSVMPMINKSFSALVSLSKTSLTANTSWDGSDYRYLNVNGVPLHLEINKGDSVYTNNNSTLYPPHELIGIVESKKKEDLGKSLELKVKLATNFSTLQNVYIIDNTHKNEIDSLLNHE